MNRLSKILPQLIKTLVCLILPLINKLLVFQNNKTDQKGGKGGPKGLTATIEGTMDAVQGSTGRPFRHDLSTRRKQGNCPRS